MRKKWLAVALAMTMVVGMMTGCGGNDAGNNTTDDGNKTPETKVETLADGGGKVLNIWVWNTEFKDLPL